MNTMQVKLLKYVTAPSINFRNKNCLQIRPAEKPIISPTWASAIFDFEIYARCWIIVFFLFIWGCGPLPSGPSSNIPSIIDKCKGDDTPVDVNWPHSPAQLNCSKSTLSEQLPPGVSSSRLITHIASTKLYNLASQDMPDIKDITQAGFAVCYLYSFMSAYAGCYPNKIKHSIKRVENGFQVLVNDPSSNNCVFISNQQLGIFLLTGNAQSRVLWPEVLAAAWVSHLQQDEMEKVIDKEINKTGTDRARGTSELRLGKTINMSLVMKDPFQYFLNKTGQVKRIKPRIGEPLTPDFPKNAHQLLEFVDDCLGNGCVMYAYVAPAGIKHGETTETGLPSGLFDHHCYGVMGVDKANQHIFIRNPHGEGSRSVAYEADGITMKPGGGQNKSFYLRAEDFYSQFYTMQFSQF